jgi:hypothetical protein
MKQLLKATALLVTGFLLGAGATVGGYLVRHRSTVVYKTTAELRAGDIRIPPGTELIHHAAMSEGFDTLALYVNVQPATLQQRFSRHVETKPLLVSPYWVEASSAER